MFLRNTEKIYNHVEDKKEKKKSKIIQWHVTNDKKKNCYLFFFCVYDSSNLILLKSEMVKIYCENKYKCLEKIISVTGEQ